jgi:UDP-3-O-[3-hydroxymyristoyl] N-acetylglucosamine deacetylase
LACILARPVTLTIAPAAPQAGLNFVRTDVADKPNVVPARYDRVVDTRLCTVIANEAGVSVATIEHLMAALRGADIHNATLEISAGEVPALDGSSAPFLAAIDRVGVVSQGARLQMLKVLEPVAITQGDKTVRLDPAEQTSFAGTIDFAHAAIGNQIHTVQMLNGNFRHEIAAARTFGLFEEVEMMRAAGFARGGSLGKRHRG